MCLEKSNTINFKWHDLKHTYATDEIRKAMPIYQLSKMLVTLMLQSWKSTLTYIRKIYMRINDKLQVKKLRWWLITSSLRI